MRRLASSYAGLLKLGSICPEIDLLQVCNRAGKKVENRRGGVWQSDPSPVALTLVRCPPVLQWILCRAKRLHGGRISVLRRILVSRQLRLIALCLNRLPAQYWGGRHLHWAIPRAPTWSLLSSYQNSMFKMKILKLNLIHHAFIFSVILVPNLCLGACCRCRARVCRCFCLLP